MNRRKFMIGAGSTVVGSAAVLGSGAFTSFSADRTASVSVAGDSTAFLGLDAAVQAGSYNTDNPDSSTDGTIDSNLVDMSSASELQIQLDDQVADGDGVNDEAVMQIGEITSGDYPDPRHDDGTEIVGDEDVVAFVMYNKFDQTIDLSVSDDGASTGNGADILELPYAVVDTIAHSIDDTKSGADLTGVTDLTVTQDEEIYVVVRVDTQTASDLSGSNEVANLTFSASPN